MSFDFRSLLLPDDPRVSRYAVVRPRQKAVEGFLVEEAILRAWCVLEGDDVTRFAASLLDSQAPRTTPEDRDVVLRWFGAQRPSARLIAQPDADRIENAAFELLETCAANGEDAFDPLV